MSQAASVVLTHGLHSSGGRSLTINMIPVFLGTSEAPEKKSGALSPYRYAQLNVQVTSAPRRLQELN